MEFSLNNGGLLKLLADLSIVTAENYDLFFLLASVLVMIVAYLFGSINTAIIVSKVAYHDDIRKYGSGNAGMTNMLRTFGKGAALATLAGDMLKTAVAVFFGGCVFGFGYVGGISLAEGGYIAALFVVLGHVFPIYYGFRGGKGVLATATAALILSPAVLGILLLVFVALVAMTKYVSLGSVSAAALYPVVTAGYINLLFGPKSEPGMVALVTVVLAILIVFCHRENLKRISERTERKLSFKHHEKIETDKKNDHDEK